MNVLNKKGFTLVELLVVIIIMLIMGVIFTNILIESLRGRNKVNIINQVKQNGQVVLDNLSNEIRSAEKVVCVDKFGSPGGTPKDTIVIFKNGIFSQYRFFVPTINANGYIKRGDFTGEDTLTNISNSELCTAIDAGTFAINFNQNLTDTDTQKGVSIDLIKTPTEQNVFEQRGDSVIIKFAALAGVKAGYAYDVTVADGGIPFTTSVQARGIKK